MYIHASHGMFIVNTLFLFRCKHQKVHHQTSVLHHKRYVHFRGQFVHHQQSVCTKKVCVLVIKVCVHHASLCISHEKPLGQTRSRPLQNQRGFEKLPISQVKSSLGPV